VIIEDDRGNKWVVQAGDPARKLVTRLERKNYTWMVLPATTMMTGELPEAREVAHDELADVRMMDCVQALEED
jgi:hypothetical protein